MENTIKVNDGFFEKQAIAFGSMKVHTDYFITSENVRIRYGFHRQTGEPRGTVVLLNGRAEFIEKYAEPIEKLGDRRFDVYTLDWRGQGLSDRLLPDRRKGHVKSFRHYIRDLREIMAEKILFRAAPPIIILAHSMGGHIALRLIHDFPDMADLLVLTAPMIDINTGPIPRWVIRFLIKFGRENAFAPGSGDYVPEEQQFEGNKLSSDPRRFRDHVNAVLKNPDLAIGGVTYGWLRAAFQSIDILNSPGYAREITVPVLLACAELDRIVSIDAQKRFCSDIPECRFCLVRGSRHEILKEADAVQSIFWDAFDDFTDFYGKL